MNTKIPGGTNRSQQNKQQTAGRPAATGSISLPMTDATFEKFRQLVYNECRIFLKPAKKPLLMNRLLSRLRKLGLRDYETYYKRVTEGPDKAEEMQHLLNAITTNKTDFFREPKQWEFLQQTLWPQMQKEKLAKKEYSIRIWSSACSSGEEPYTIAIHALENLSKTDPWKIQILASDISEKVLAKARAGVYEESKLGPIPKQMLTKYFTKDSSGLYRAKPEIQRLITFRNVNLKGNMPRFVQPLDIIFCRNVIIYFDKPTQADLMKRFYSCLRKGGHLFLGHSESLNGICDLYQFVRASIYRKRRVENHGIRC